MIETLKSWLSRLEYRAVAVSMLILAAAIVAALTATHWSKISDERKWNGEQIVLIEDNQIATPSDLLSGDNDQKYSVLAIRDFRARMLVTLTVFLALTACFVVFIYCLPNIFSSRGFSILFLGIVLGLIAVYTLKPPTDHMFPTYDTLLERMECFRTLKTNEANECGYDSSQGGRTRFTHVGNTLLSAAVFAIAVSVWRLISGIASLSPQAAANEKSLNTRKEILREANQGIAVHLYLASALLVVSVITLHSYYSWPAALVTDESLANGLRGLATVVALVFGTGFTILIVVVIGPALYVINTRTDELAQVAARVLSRDVTEDATRTWREKNGFVTTIQQRAFRLLATIGPVLAGPLVELLNIQMV